jgi:hypothetical protein
MKTLCAAVAIAAFLVAAEADSQWVKVPDPTVPRTADGEPDLGAPAPRTPDGKTDLSGVWLADTDPDAAPISVEHMPLPLYFVNIAADMPFEAVPYQPWAAELFQQRLANEGRDTPTASCKPTGVPALDTAPLPYKIVQSPELVLILYEENTVFRQIFLDGREPVEDAEPRWMGYSTGRWDGDALVVETVGFNDQLWLDAMGHPHSEALRLIQRFRRSDVGHLAIETTIDDPGAYTKPITYTVTATLLPDEDLLEYFCTENEKDVEHYQ